MCKLLSYCSKTIAAQKPNQQTGHKDVSTQTNPKWHECDNISAVPVKKFFFFLN